MADDLVPVALTQSAGQIDRPAFPNLAARISTVYATVYLHYGAFGIFLPMWFAHRGLSPEQIGILIALPMLLRVLVVAPVTNLADRLRRIREVFLVCVVGAMLIMTALPIAHGYWQLILFFTVFALVWDPLPILADSYAVLAVRTQGLDYGRMRLWGSLAFVAANVACGQLIENYSVEIVPWLTAALLAAPIVPILLLPSDRLLGKPDKAAPMEWRGIVRDKTLMAVMLGCALITSSHVILTTFGAIQWTASGISGATIGVLVSLGILGEIAVMFAAQKLLGSRSPLWLIAIGGAVAIVRWLITATNPPVPVLAALMLANGLTGMGAITGLMLFVAQRVEGRLISTTQGINAVVVGGLAALATAGSGFAWKAMGTQSYLLAALVAGAGLGLSLLALRRAR